MAALSYQPSSRLSTTLAFERDTKPSNRLDSRPMLDGLAEFARDLCAWVSNVVEPWGSHRSSRVEGAALRPGVDISDEETNSVFGALNMKLSERFSLSLDASHQEREADVAGFQYESQRVGSDRHGGLLG